ncbi:GrpB family protein [Alteribacter populi]|uniref:GrpB family protein n=1 Tax=Alteribacter populi TaxID=2011011 RepID=UPI000BBA484B|nr:GrpB family protein [Alteribacter populi]
MCVTQSDWPVWATESVEIIEPDPKWIDKGMQEKNELYTILSPYGITEVEHFGSTSIRHLLAKPIIDLMAKTESFERIDEISSALIKIDWHFVPPNLDNRPWRRFFVKVKNDKRSAHLHIMYEGDERWEKQLLFRDRLRMNEKLRAEYAHLKRNLAKEFQGDREAYTKAKTTFVNKVLE